MGQQNQKISIEQFQQKRGDGNSNKKKIFQNSYKSTSFYKEQQCKLPNCNCPAQHVQIKNLKVCNECEGRNGYPNFRKNRVLNYKQQSLHLRQPRSAGFSQIPYQELRPTNQQPFITYYNAWSLPIQPCYNQKITDSRAITNDQSFGQSSNHHQIPVRPIKKPEPPQFILDDESHQESIIHPGPNYDDVDDRDRRQKLFMYDKSKMKE